MAVNTKAIKTRIRSVKNTKKITKAMEMVSAAKMRKAVEATLSTRLYATMARELLRKLSKIEQEQAPLLAVRPVKKVLAVVISSNRGLCGSYNSNVLKKASVLVRDLANYAVSFDREGKTVMPESSIALDMIGVGKKSAGIAQKLKANLIAVYDNISEKLDFSDILPLTNTIINDYASGTYDKVFVVYTDFKSSLVQETVIRQVLPLSVKEIDSMLEVMNRGVDKIVMPEMTLDDYILEPNAAALVDSVIPRLVETQVYQAVLESAASEHSARMVAMKSASDAAGDMIKALTTEFNKGRQAAITQEIAEIVGGTAALE